jgi:hypothetical protein
MKRVFPLLLLITLFQRLVFSQSVNPSSCPTFSVTGPSGTTEPEGPMNFTAEIKDFDISKLKFEWIVKNGEIIKGLGTISLVVKPIECSIPTIATIKILGLPEYCQNTLSAEGLISDCGYNFTSRPIVEYERITKKEEKERLGKLTFELRNYPSATGFVVKYIPHQTNKTSLYRNLQQILNFGELYGVDKNRIRFLILYSADERTQLFVGSPENQLIESSSEILDAAKVQERLKASQPQTKKKHIRNK